MQATPTRGLSAFLATTLALLWFTVPDSIGQPPAVGLFLFGGAALGVLVFSLVDLLAATLPTRRLTTRQLQRAAGLLLGAPLVLLVVNLARSGALATMPALLVAGLVLAVLAVLAIPRLAPRLGAPDSPRFWLAAVFAGLQLLALFVHVHLAEDTFLVVRPGSAGLHTILFFGTWLLSIALLLPWAARISHRIHEAPPSRWFWGWSAVAALIGVGALAVDRRLMVGLYPGVHLWLEFIGVLSLDAALSRLFVHASPPRKPGTVRALRALGAAALLTIVLAAAGFAVVAIGGHADDRAFRAAIAETAPGPALLRLARSGGPTERGDQLALRHEDYHQVQPPANDWNIILISIDAFRGDFIPDPEDPDKSGAPRLAELASTCVDFRRAYAPGSRTAIGMGALMLGRYSAHINWELWIWDGKLVNAATVSPDAIRSLGNNLQYTTIPQIPPEGNLAQRLKAAGLKTLATPWDGYSKFFRKGAGFDAGFDAYTDMNKHKWREPASPNVLPLALKQIDRAKGKRFFQWIHLFDPHESGGDRKRYGELVRDMDSALGEFLDALDERRLRDDTVIVLVADHGEGLGDHRHKTHGTSLYEEQVRVPMLICLPKRPGQVFRRPVSTLDAAATMLALAGADLTGVDGVNLLPLIEAGTYPVRRPVFTELHRYQSSQAERTVDMQAVILDQWKLIRDLKHDTAQLFDLATDPSEAASVLADQPVIARELEGLLDALNAGRSEPKPPQPLFSARPAAFDVTERSALLWASATLPAEIHFELATAEDFADVIATPQVKVGKDTDFIHIADVADLTPDTRYYYRPVLTHLGERLVGDVGTFVTAAVEPRAVRIAWSADLMADHAPFKIFDALRREQPDLFLMLGDTMYADIPAKNRAKDLRGFRTRHRAIRRDGPLQSFLASTATAAIWDDHEIANNAHGGSKSLEIARQVFREQWPVRRLDPEEPGLYRAFRPAPQVEVFMLDVRSFRDPPKDRTTMLGAAQKAWLFTALKASTARTKLVVSSVPLLAPFGDDSWLAFPSERDELLALFASEPPGTVVVLSGDYHLAWHLVDPKTGLNELIAGPLGAWTFKGMQPERLPDVDASGRFAITNGANFGVLDISPEGDVTARYLDGKGKEKYRVALTRPGENAAP